MTTEEQEAIEPLAPCPVCEKSEEISRLAEGRIQSGGKGGGNIDSRIRYYVQCDTCGLRAPLDTDRAGSHVNWNHLAASARALEVAREALAEIVGDTEEWSENSAQGTARAALAKIDSLLNNTDHA